MAAPTETLVVTAAIIDGLLDRIEALEEVVRSLKAEIAKLNQADNPSKNNS